MAGATRANHTRNAAMDKTGSTVSFPTLGQSAA
jgi:hypothetical protein